MSAESTLVWVKSEFHRGVEQIDAGDWTEGLVTFKVALAALVALLESEKP